MKISVVIPTRRRAGTLGRALATLSAPRGRLDLEVVVQNNGGDPSIRAVVEAATDLSIVYHETIDDVPMAANWDLAVEKATGDYVIVIGDDDGISADFFVSLEQIFDELQPSLIRWEAALYGWPDCRIDEYRDRLIVPRPWDPIGVRWEDSQAALSKVYRFESPIDGLPSIYHGLVSRALIDAARARYGRYFLTAIPDLFTGVLNATMADRFLYCTRALSISGSSGASTGAAFLGRATADQPLAAFLDGQLDRSTLLPDERPWLLHLVIAETLIEAAQYLSAGPRRLELHLPALVAAIVGNAWRYPADYDEMVRIGRALADRFGVGIDWDRVRTDVAPLGGRPIGYAQGADGVWRLTVDCAPVGVADVRAAAGLIRALVGSR